MATVVIDELRTYREFGPGALNLLVSVMDKEIARFPALLNDPALTSKDFALDFFAAKGKALTVDAVLKADDDGALEAMMRSWTKHWLDDENDKTAIGGLRQLLVKRLQRDRRFWQGPVKHHWGLADGPHEAMAADLERLIPVARKCPVTMGAWHPEARRRPNLGKSGELEGLMAAVLQEAGGCLHLSYLTRILADRLPNLVDPLCVYPDDADGAGWDRIESDVASLGDWDSSVPEDMAGRVFAALSVEERKLVLVIGNPSQAQALLGLGKSQTALRMKAVKAKLVELSGGESGKSPEVLRLVIRMCGQDDPGPDGLSFVPLTEGGGRYS